MGETHNCSLFLYQLLVYQLVDSHQLFFFGVASKRNQCHDFLCLSKVILAGLTRMSTLSPKISIGTHGFSFAFKFFSFENKTIFSCIPEEYMIYVLDFLFSLISNSTVSGFCPSLVTGWNWKTLYYDYPTSQQ